MDNAVASQPPASSDPPRGRAPGLSSLWSTATWPASAACSSAHTLSPFTRVVRGHGAERRRAVAGTPLAQVGRAGRRVDLGLPFRCAAALGQFLIAV